MKLFTILLCLISLSAGSPAGAAMNYDSVQNSKEKQIQDIRNEEIKTVKRALSLRNQENRRAELYLRLAELYLEAYQADFLLEGRLQEQALQKNPNAKFIRERTVHDLKNGIGAAEEILSLNVDPKKLDQVYYFLGYNYSQYGDTKKSAKYYKKLATDYPNSQYAVEGYRAIGEEAFARGDYSEAQSSFEQALRKTKEPSQQARLYHKLAWCYYRQKRTNDAIESMKKGIALAQGDQEKFLNIREEGLRDLAIYYAESGRVDEAIDYFKRNAGGGEKGEEKLIKVLEKLGKEYERTGQTDKAKQVYDVLLKFQKGDESSFRVAVKLVDLDLMKQDFERAYQRLQNLEVPKTQDVDTQLAISNLKRQIRSTAVNNHDRYRKMDDKKEVIRYLRVADQFYAIYLSRYVTDKAERNEIRMYLAEVKRELKNPGMAAQLYKAVIQDQDQKYAQEAAQLWVGSLAAELKQMSASGEKQGAELSPLERDFVDASDLLEKSIPNSTESREARLRSAQILAAYPNEKANAVSRASKLAKNHQNTQQGVLAARLWLQLSPDKNTLTQVSSDSVLLDTDRKGKGDLAKDISSLSRKLKVSDIASLEQGKNYTAAAQHYEEFAREAKTPKEAENSYIGAINAYAQAKSSDDVFRVMKDWKAKYPKSANIEKTVKNQGTLFFIRGFFNDAAELFLGIGRQFKDFSSYLTSAALFDGGLQSQKAIDVYKMSLGLAPNEEEKAKVYRLMAYVYADMRDELNSFNSWKTCYSFQSSLKAECGTQMGNHYLNLKDHRQAGGIFEQVVSIRKGPSAKSPYIAYAQFRLAQILEKGMKNVPLQFPEEQLLKAFNQRVEELKPVTGAYQKAIELGGPWGIAATERLGDLSLGLAAEVAKVLQSSQAKPALKQALEPVVGALQNKALENSKSAYAQATKQQILSPALPVIHDRLVDANVAGMSRAQGARSGVKLIGMSPDGGKVGANAAFEGVRAKLQQSQEDALSWIDYGNLLWGTGKPGLSKVAYQRSLDLKTRKSDALNNLAVVMVSDQGFENWFAANEAVALWKRALSTDSHHSAALFNLGHYFNYFRLFSLALPYFEKAVAKVSISEVHDGMAVASYALGKHGESELEFKKAEELGGKENRFVKKYVEAAKNEANRSVCQDAISDISGLKELKGFEKISVDRMRARCQ
jgi:tetratricopeptide (TPR) repeat protein